MEHTVPAIAHICEPHFCGLASMREMYEACKVYPTSTNGDIMLIRSHIAYWQGKERAERAVIKPSRGHSYTVRTSALPGAYKVIVRISDYYDHRNGVHEVFNSTEGTC